MASILALPNELLDEVLASLDRSDLINVSISCRLLHEVTKATLYRSVVFEWTWDWTVGADSEQDFTQPPNFVAFCRLLILKPEYAKLVKSLDFSAPQCWSYSDDSDETPMLFVPAKQLKIGATDKLLFQNSIKKQPILNADIWITRLGFGEPSAVELLIVALCTRLESLSVSTELLMEHNWLRSLTFQRLSAVSEAGNVPWLNKLRHLSIMSPTAKLASQRSYKHLVEFHASLFHLLGLETLELSAFVERSKHKVPDSGPLSQYPEATALTTLRLLHSAVTSRALQLFLGQTINLQVFEYTYDMDQRTLSKSPNFSLSALNKALFQLRTTLRDLTVRYEIHANEGDYYVGNSNLTGSLGPLCDFLALTSLHTSLAVLMGKEGLAPLRVPDLASFLPRHLCKLTVTDDLWSFREFSGRFEDVEAMKIFRKYLSGERIKNDWPGELEYDVDVDNWDYGFRYGKISWEDFDEPGRRATLELQEFTYDIRNRYFCSDDYWTSPRARDEFQQLCKAQGITGVVLCPELGWIQK